MKLGWSAAIIGAGVALGSNAGLAADAPLAPVVRVMGDPAPVAGQPCPPGPVMTPGQAATPGQPMAPIAGAPAITTPVTEVFSQAPAAGSTGSETFNPNMIGDLPALTYAGTFVDRGGFGYALVPQVQRGAFKISDNESPQPQDRVFAYYNYYNNIAAPAPFFVGPQGLVTRLEYDVHRETMGFEKTFLDGDASLGLRVSATQADGIITDDDFGDLTVISKFALINRCRFILSTGLAVTAPTGSDNSGGFGNSYRSVLFQPYIGSIWNRNRLYVHGFNAIIFSTDDRDPILTTADFGAGYRLWTSGCLLRHIIPTVEGHVNLPISKEGFANRLETAQPDSFIVTTGVHFGLGCRANLTIGAATPLSGPRIFDYEGIAQLNWRF
jgi:hypothetical protein